MEKRIKGAHRLGPSLDGKRERFFVFSRSIHAPTLGVIYAERSRAAANRRATAWNKLGIPGTRTLIVRMEPSS